MSEHSVSLKISSFDNKSFFVDDLISKFKSFDEIKSYAARQFNFVSTSPERVHLLFNGALISDEVGSQKNSNKEKNARFIEFSKQIFSSKPEIFAFETTRKRSRQSLKREEEEDKDVREGGNKKVQRDQHEDDSEVFDALNWSAHFLNRSKPQSNDAEENEHEQEGDQNKEDEKKEKLVDNITNFRALQSAMQHDLIGKPSRLARILADPLTIRLTANPQLLTKWFALSSSSSSSSSASSVCLTSADLAHCQEHFVTMMAQQLPRQRQNDVTATTSATIEKSDEAPEFCYSAQDIEKLRNRGGQALNDAMQTIDKLLENESVALATLQQQVRDDQQQQKQLEGDKEKQIKEDEKSESAKLAANVCFAMSHFPASISAMTSQPKFWRQLLNPEARAYLDTLSDEQIRAGVETTERAIASSNSEAQLKSHFENLLASASLSSPSSSSLFSLFENSEGKKSEQQREEKKLGVDEKKDDKRDLDYEREKNARKFITDLTQFKIGQSAAATSSSSLSSLCAMTSDRRKLFNRMGFKHLNDAELSKQLCASFGNLSSAVEVLAKHEKPKC